MHTFRFAIACVATLLLFPCPLAASDGRVEISQTTVTAAVGYPFKIDRAGSYVLTSDLSVPPGMTGIQIAADGVSLDLNGFAIRGSYVCGPGSCVPGGGRGIESLPLVTSEAQRSSVSNGEISGFGQECVRLGPDAALERLVVAGCAGHCVFAQEGSLTRGCRIHGCGSSGIASNGPGIYAQNVIRLVGLAGAADFVSPSLRGATNVCDVGTCPGERRRYYLSKLTFQGDHGGNTCASGFHFASVWELMNPTSLQYDTTLGITRSDSGQGPPVAEIGWVRSSSYAANNNCFEGQTPWVSTSAGNNGTAVSLQNPESWNNAAGFTSPWLQWKQPCNLGRGAWCIED